MCSFKSKPRLQNGVTLTKLAGSILFCIYTKNVISKGRHETRNPELPVVVLLFAKVFSIKILSRVVYFFLWIQNQTPSKSCSNKSSQNERLRDLICDTYCSHTNIRKFNSHIHPKFTCLKPEAYVFARYKNY
jgi:hypothetical protein